MLAVNISMPTVACPHQGSQRVHVILCPVTHVAVAVMHMHTELPRCPDCERHVGGGCRGHQSGGCCGWTRGPGSVQDRCFSRGNGTSVPILLSNAVFLRWHLLPSIVVRPSLTAVCCCRHRRVAGPRSGCRCLWGRWHYLLYLLWLGRCTLSA